MISYFKCLGKYAVFRGRASRLEYWGYNIVNAVIIFVLLLLDAKFQTGALSKIFRYAVIAYVVLTLLPTIAVMSRRWHDLDRTGAWVFLNLVPLVGTVVSMCFFLGRGSRGTNRFGRDPREKKFKKRSKKRY